MSTNLFVDDSLDVSMTRFFGGSERGVCVMVSRDGQSISFTRDEAQVLADAFQAFADGEEQENWD